MDILFYIREDTNGWLSNFERAPMVIDGKEYPTNEHYYQSMKAKDPLMKEWIRTAPTAWAAMKAGRALREHETETGWVDGKKYEVMKKGLKAKFTQHEYLKQNLLATGSSSIHENSETDMIWGIKGKDMLGKLIMEVRDEL